MKASLDFADFSFLSIAPVPGLTQLKWQSAVLLGLGVCEVLVAVLDSASWLLVVGLSLLALVTAGLYRTVWQLPTSCSQLTRIHLLARLTFILKLLLFSLMLAISVHKLLIMDCIQSDLTPCAEQLKWWRLSAPALACEGVCSAAEAVLVLYMLKQLKKVALELRFRSLAHYLEL